MSGPLRFRILRGQPIENGTYRVTPLAWAFSASLRHAGLVRAGPLAVTVETDTSRRRVPVVYSTTLIQMTTFAAAAVVAILLIMRSRSRKEHGR
jgi:hypothetical protein